MLAGIQASHLLWINKVRAKTIIQIFGGLGGNFRKMETRRNMSFWKLYICTVQENFLGHEKEKNYTY